jgi:histone deacetylase 6
MASDMRSLGGKDADIPSHGLENGGVSDGKHECCYDCDDEKLSLPGVNGKSSLIESHTEGKSSVAICGVCGDHADDLVKEATDSKSRSSHVEVADHDSHLAGRKGSCMAAADLPHESEIEQAGGTLEGLFFFNDEEEDDSDWEPTNHLAVNRWFCLNCTMPNMAEIAYCLVR